MTKVIISIHHGRITSWKASSISPYWFSFYETEMYKWIVLVRPGYGWIWFVGPMLIAMTLSLKHTDLIFNDRGNYCGGPGILDPLTHAPQPCTACLLLVRKPKSQLWKLMPNWLKFSLIPSNSQTSKLFLASCQSV